MGDLKCFLITMGIGFAVGAMVASTNKKVSDVAKQASQVAMEKVEQAKEGLTKIKDKIEENIEAEKIETGTSTTATKSTKKAKN